MHPIVKPEDQPQEISSAGYDIFNESNPRSVINIVPEPVRRAMLLIPGEYLAWDEQMLKRQIKPNATTSRLRISFWQEYNRAQEDNKPINITRVYAGVCTNGFFYNKFLPQSALVAWMITPPTDYMKAMQETLVEGVDQLREIVTLPVRDQSGAPIYQNIDRILKAFAIVDNRVRGAVVQKIETKNMHVMKNITEAEDMKDIQKRILQIEKEKQNLIEATPIKEE